MTTLHIDLESDNAAFEDNGHFEAQMEIARILHKLAERIANCLSPYDAGSLYDLNGNKVGLFKFTTGEE